MCDKIIKLVSLTDLRDLINRIVFIPLKESPLLSIL